MPEVERIITPLTCLEVARSLRDGHVRQTGSKPSLSRWAGMCGHIFLEQARGQRTNNRNMGNLTANPAWISAGGDWFGLDVPPPDPPRLKFRSYPTVIDGAAGYVALMLGRYAAAVRCFDYANFSGACAELKARGYMTAALAPYSKAVVALATWSAANLLPPLINDPEPAADCAVPECDGELHSLLTEAQIEEILSFVMLTAIEMTAEDPMFTEHGDPGKPAPAD